MVSKINIIHVKNYNYLYQKTVNVLFMENAIQKVNGKVNGEFHCKIKKEKKKSIKIKFKGK